MRPFLAGIMFAGVFFAPWWVPLLIGAVLAFRFAVWEAVLAAFFVDLLYGMPHSWTAYFPATAAMILVILLLAPLRASLMTR